MSVDDFQNSPASRPAAMVEPRVSHWPINSGLWLPCKSNGSCTARHFKPTAMAHTARRARGAVFAGAHIKRPRQRLRFFQARIINTFKEIFNQPAHVTKVFGRADNNGVGRQHILHTGGQRKQQAGIDIFKLCRRPANGVGQMFGVFRRVVGDND